MTTLPVPSPAPQGSAPIQRFRIDGESRPNAYVQQPGESAEEHRLRMAQEIAALRKTMEDKDALPIEERAEGDDYGPQGGEDWPDQPRKKPDPQKVEQALLRTGGPRPTPTVAVSYRGGFGYDAGVFSKGSTRADVVSAPPGFDPLPIGATREEAQDRENEAIGARNPDPEAVKAHLAHASGLYIPGGQDIPKEGTPEQTSREDYEQALIRHARLRGIPTLAVCGGSRCLARGFGGSEATLSKSDQKIHNQQGTVKMPHGLSLAPHTILGGATPTPDYTVDAINSTHKKIVDSDPGTGELRGVNRLPATDEPELQVSARDPESGHPEGFETTHGAPIVGVTSHPEAIHGASRGAREAASVQGRTWSDNVFKGFEQSMQSYAGRQQVNAEILETVKKVKRVK